MEEEKNISLDVPNIVVLEANEEGRTPTQQTETEIGTEIQGLSESPEGSQHKKRAYNVDKMFSRQSMGEFFGYISKAEQIEVKEKEKLVSTKAKPTQGTLGGVFFPCLQNILGVLLFIRVPQITGEAGVGHSLLLILLCITTTFLTILSMSAIATNGKIKGGGSYYLISRSLGPALGGSVGLLFFLANAFGAALYILGAVETFLTATGIEIWGLEFDMRFFGTILLVFLIFLNLIGLKYVAKMGFLFMATVLISILSIYLGIFVSKYRSGLMEGVTGIENKNMEDNFPPDYEDNTFFILLSIYFPSVTGIMAGSNRSGDLKSPSQSIPKGTLWAHFVSSFIYLSSPILFAWCATHEALVNEDKIFTAEVAWPWKELVQLGIVLSSSGAGLQALAGAPRLLEAIAKDDLVYLLRPFAKGIRRCILCALFFSFIAVMIGSVNAIAPILTMFFLICYAFVNGACFLLDYIGSPNWRPTWKYYSKIISLIGGFMCIMLMFIIRWWAALIAIVLAVLLYLYIDFKAQHKNWGDGLQGIKYERAKNALLNIDRADQHVKNWRPNYLTLSFYKDISKLEERAKGLIKFLYQMKKASGLAIYGAVHGGKYTEQNYTEAREEELKLDSYMKDQHYNIFSKVIVCESMEEGLLSLMQSSGLGGLQPNTVLFQWPLEWRSNIKKARTFVRILEDANLYGHSLNVLKPGMAFDLSKKIRLKGNIDIWSVVYDGGILLMLAYLLMKSKIWKKCKVRFFVITPLKEADLQQHEKESQIHSLLVRYRLFTHIPIEMVYVDPEDIEQHAKGIEERMIKKETLINKPVGISMAHKESIKATLTDFHHKEIKLMIDLRMKQEALRKESDTIMPVPLERNREGSLFSHHQSTKLNMEIIERSVESELVIMNIPTVAEDQSAEDYLEYCESITLGLKRTLFVRGTGAEVITEFT